MMTRFSFALLAAILLGLLLTVPVLAGGWAVVTLDELPSNVTAGQPITVGFMVRQHGRTPLSGLTPAITARLFNSTDAIKVDAKPDNRIGHYVATLTFPEPGSWDWSIQAFTMDQPMPALNVAAGVGKSITRPAANTSLRFPLVIVRIASLLIALIGAVVALRRKSRQAMALAVLCLLIGSASFVAMTGTSPRAEAQSNSFSKVANETSISQAELGKKIFIAKGCVTCHMNSKIPRDMRGAFTVDIGPNLSTFTADPDYLRKWLFKPSAIKPATQMPDLNLSEEEINALIAFINSK